jgi:hypothetical protein
MTVLRGHVSTRTAVVACGPTVYTAADLCMSDRDDGAAGK